MIRCLNDFIILTAQQKAKEIIEERERIIVSKKDRDIFFESITNPGNLNKELIEAAEKYNAKLS